MMLSAILAIVTSLPALILTGGLGTGLPLLALLGVLKDGWVSAAKWGGLVLLVLAAFILGYRVADERAADAATIARLESQVLSLNDQLGDLMLVDSFASSERSQLQADKAAAGALAETYKTQLALQSQKAPFNACSLDAADLRFRSQLRSRAAR